MANVANVGRNTLPEFQKFLSDRKVVEEKTGPAQEVVPPKDAADALSEMSRVIRLRHYFYSTERSYLQWGEERPS